MYDLVIVGAGPAGLSAAVYAARAKLNFIVIEKELMCGGQIINTSEVDNYLGLYHLGGFDMALKFREHAEALGAEFVTGEVERLEDTENGKKIFTKEGNWYETKTVLISGGAKHRKLMVPGEEALCGMGVSYCATCDGAFFKGKEVAVVGGGDVAVEDALFLSKLCKKVTLIHRRGSFRASKAMVELLMKAANIQICYDTVVEKIDGTDCVESITVIRKESGETKRIPVSAVFIAVGMLPETEWLGKTLQLDEAGYICAGESCETSDPAVFAAGDIRTKQLRQLITAAGDGANAITSVERFLCNGKFLS